MLCTRTVSRLRLPPPRLLLSPSLLAFQDIPTHSRGKKSRGHESLLDKYNMMQKKKRMAKVFDVWESMSVRDLARVLDKPTEDVLDLVLTFAEAEHLESEWQPFNDRKLLVAVGRKLGVKFRVGASPAARVMKVMREEEEDLDVKTKPPRPEELRPRPPVVAIMGHVDHGKTTLLDHLRQSRIVEGEFGGITQHIGAFSVRLPGQDGAEKRKVTFVDTPGHAAFKAMRSRGARTTDIVVLMVDVNEGVKEQTLESLRMIEEARTPMIVALNKIDRPEADVEGTKRQLKEEAGVDLEDFGGDVQSVPISALTGQGVPELVEALSALAEVQQLSADWKGPVEGVVLESSVKHGLGKSATVLLQRGVLKKGDHLVAGICQAKVKKLLDDRDKEVREAAPSEAVTVVGWKEIPSAGDVVNQVESDRRAAEVVRWRLRREQKRRDKEAAKLIERQQSAHREEYLEYRMRKLELGLFKPKYGRHGFHVRRKEAVEYGGPTKVSLVVKADVDGSLEAILNCLETYDSVGEEVALDLVSFGVGEVTDNDVLLAKEFDSIVYAFNTKVSPAVQRRLAEENVPLREYNVIYHLVDDLKEEINRRLPPTDEETVTGKAEVLQEFVVSGERRRRIPVAGCQVRSGRLERGTWVRVVRESDGSVAYDGEISGLRHLKEEVEEVETGRECGVVVADSEIRFFPGDQIIAYYVKKVPQVTAWSPGF